MDDPGNIRYPFLFGYILFVFGVQVSLDYPMKCFT